MNVHPDEFAAQVNYLAAIGRMIVPRAFAFADRKLLFVGHGPFDPEDIAALLPESADWQEHGAAPEGFVPDVIVLGRDGFEKGAVKAALDSARGSPKLVPQEGLLDELLFGHDWWKEKTQDLEAMVNTHRGLQSARAQGALSPAGIEKPQPKKAVPKLARNVGKKVIAPRYDKLVFSPYGSLPEKTKEEVQESSATFSWPNLEVQEKASTSEAELNLRARSRLNELGYTTREPASKRWRILTKEAIPELGLPPVANMIAWYCRFYRNHPNFVDAIPKWKHDLDRLKREVYRNYRPRFNWPRSEP